MKGSVKTVFPGNNSAEGFYSFYESGLSAMDHVYILKGGPGTGKSSFMRHLGEAFRDRGFYIELWQCSSDNDSLDGVLIPAYKTAVVDGTAPHTLDPVYPGAREEILNLGEFWKNNALRKEKDAIVSLTDRISAAFDDAYKKLKTAGEWDDRLLSCRKTDASQESGAESLVKELFGDEYLDYDLVFCHSSGRPMEGQVINRALKKLIQDNDLPDVVFHSFRHASITYKLKWNGGDMKSVQGDSGHARMDMVADVYSHIIDEDRRYNAQKFEEQFYNAKGLKNAEEGKTAPMPKFETSVELLDPMAEVQKGSEVEEEKPAENSADENAALLAKLLSNPDTAALLKALAKTI